MVDSRNEQWRVDLRKSHTPKERTAIERVVMPQLDPKYRITCNEEVNEGISEEQAVREATRCLDCANPQCVTGCPVGINIPKFIKNIERGHFADAAAAIKETSSLPAVCGRVCPQEKQCESKCIHVKMKHPAVAIGYLERFAADWQRNHCEQEVPKMAPRNGIKIAVVGSGPSGLSFAGDMAKKGYSVTVFEKDIIIGKTLTYDDLHEMGFKGVFVGSGAGFPRFMDIPGENLKGVMSSNEYLTRINLMKAGRGGDTPVMQGNTIAVIGGGNTAMDSTRTALRMGAKRVLLVYRRSEAEMPARREEVGHAKEEGVEFYTLHNPIEYIGDDKGFVKAMRVQKMQLGEPDASGRRRPVPIEGPIEEIPVDIVIVAVGVSPNQLVPSSIKGLEVSNRHTIVVNDDTMQSNIADLFAGGDIVRGGATVILAMGDGRKAAQHMHEVLSQK